MAVQNLKQSIFFSSSKIKSKHNLHLFSSHGFSTSSPPSDQSTPNHPPISTVVSVLTQHRSKSRWSHLLSLCPSGFTPSQFSHVALSLKNNPHLLLRFFFFTQRKSLCKHDISSYATLIHLLSRGRLTSHAQNLIREAIRLPPYGLETKQELKLFEVLVKRYCVLLMDSSACSCIMAIYVSGISGIAREKFEYFCSLRQ